MRIRFAACLLAVALVASGGCGLGVDLEKALEVTDVSSGWYDFGLVGGLNKMVPQVSFRLKNVAEKPLTQIQLIVSFWPDGADGELDSKNVDGIGRAAVAPRGASCSPTASSRISPPRSSRSGMARSSGWASSRSSAASCRTSRPPRGRCHPCSKFRRTRIKKSGARGISARAAR
jgi:hypothetical protein